MHSNENKAHLMSPTPPASHEGTVGENATQRAYYRYGIIYTVRVAVPAGLIGLNQPVQSRLSR